MPKRVAVASHRQQQPVLAEVDFATHKANDQPSHDHLGVSWSILPGLTISGQGSSSW